MLKKELRISAKLDSGDFDKTVADMQRKLKDIYSASGPNTNIGIQDRLSKGGFGAAPTESQRRQADLAEKQNRRDLDIHIREQVKAQDEMNKKLAEKLEILKKIQSTEGAIYDYNTKVKEAKDEISKIQNNISQNQAGLNESLNLRDRLNPKGPSFMGVAQGFQQGGFMGGMGAMGISATAMGIAGLGIGAAGMGLNYFRSGMNAPQYSLQNRAAATEEASDRLYKSASGSLLYDMPFEGNRDRATSMAQEKRKKSGFADIFTGKEGSIIGNDLVTDSLTSGAGGTLGYLAGGAMKLFGGSYKSTYESGKTKEFAQDINSNFEAMKSESPLSKIGIDKLRASGERDLSLQRSLGFNQGDMNQYFKNGNNLGFTQEQLISGSQGVLGAGGSTRMAQSSGFVNQMASKYNMTNAAQSLGALSGTMGDAKTSENTYLKIMSEAVRSGFDKSEFAEENRKFTGLLSDTISSMGVRSEGKASEVAAKMSDFITGNSMRDIGIGKSNFDIYQGRQTEGGSRESLRMSYLSKNLKGAGLADVRTSLGRMPISSMDENNPEFQGMYEKAKKANPNMSMEDFKKIATGAGDYGQTGVAGGNRDALTKKLSDIGKKYSSVEEARQDPQYREIQNQLSSEIRKTDTALQNAPSDVLESMSEGLAGFKSQGVSSTMLSSPKEGKFQDSANKATASTQAAFIGATEEAAKSLSAAVVEVKAFSNALIAATAKFQTKMLGATTDAERNAITKEFTEATSRNPLMQPSVMPKDE